MPPTVVFKEQNDGQTRRHSESSQPGINALSAAVQAASQQQLSLLLQQLCDQDETAANFARKHLFPSPQTPRRIKHRTIPEEATPTKTQPPPKRSTLLKSILKPTKSPAPEEPQQAESPPPPKRKLSIQCRNCGSPFTSSNAEGSCTHHPGKASLVHQVQTLRHELTILFPRKTRSRPRAQSLGEFRFGRLRRCVDFDGVRGVRLRLSLVLL